MALAGHGIGIHGPGDHFLLTHYLTLSTTGGMGVCIVKEKKMNENRIIGGILLVLFIILFCISLYWHYAPEVKTYSIELIDSTKEDCPPWSVCTEYNVRIKENWLYLIFLAGLSYIY